ncbi:MAG TPA: ATP F0F1 synthase subunit B [Paracoccaceae bacterium]|nr:ATP F0F1 synthase subunit B [Paracoccaceae bacterium]
MSLVYDTNVIYLVSFLIFIGILIWAKVPALIGRALDGRAARIRGEIEEARRLREEAQSLLASYERKQKEVERLAEDIIERAREDAQAAAAAGKANLERAVARRLKAAEDQIAAAEAAAIRQIRDKAASIAVAAAAEIMAKSMPPEEGARLIDAAIEETAKRLH